MNLLTKVPRSIRWGVGLGLGVLGSIVASARTITIPVPPHPEIHRANPIQISVHEVRRELQQGIGPKIRLDDSAYVRLEHSYLPVLLDWHHEMRAHFARINDGDGVPPRVHNERAAHVMRVMLEFAVRNDAGYGDAALMIGAVRLELPVDWRENQAGDRIDVVLVGTDQGYFLVDPTTRTIVPYTDQLQASTVWLHM